MTDSELIEELARAMAAGLCTGSPFDDDKPEDYHAEGVVAASAILPIIKRREIEAGEKVKEAAAREVNHRYGVISQASVNRIRALNVEEILK